MTQLSWNEIQDRASEFVSQWRDTDTILSERGNQKFWSDFLDIYGIDSRRHGAFFEYAIKKGSGKQGFIDMFWPGKLLVEQKAPGRDLDKANLQAWEYLETMPDHDLPQMIVLSDFTKFECINTTSREKIIFSLEELPRNVKLFGFLIEQSSSRYAESNPVNVKAAEAMATLHNQLRDDNYNGHDLEVLLVRLVFCMFADDSGIFDHQVLQHYVAERTHEDGSDLGPRLMQLFQALNTPKDQRQTSLDESLMSMPYVNGGLFAESIRTPYFNSKMRQTILETMRLDWASVSPAIFGSMFQGVMDKEQRRNLGAHYTSEKNILRVIKPLFLDDLYKEFADCMAAGPRKKYDELRKLQDKLATLRFLDPACGCGNFLVITYRELRRLEHKIVNKLQSDDTAKGLRSEHQSDWLASSDEHGRIKTNVDQMYGIEIEEFPSLIAQTALWLTDHQMNREYSAESGRTFKRLPLTHSATICNDNALTKDWTEVIAPKELNYILGNPPFLGYKYQSSEQKIDMASITRDIDGGKILDFVTAWYIKAETFISDNATIDVGFVSTNSIVQGEHVPILWKYLFSKGVQVNFAHQTFKWGNDASNNAGVYCVIIGFSKTIKSEKRIFEYPIITGEPTEIIAKEINGYLVAAPSVFIERRSKPINADLSLIYGNEPREGGFLLFSSDEKSEIIANEPGLTKFIRRFVSADDYINNRFRYCFWLKGAALSEIIASPELRRRLQSVKDFRNDSKQVQAHEAANRPSEFVSIRQPLKDYLLVPIVSSERREYIPIGYVNSDVIASNACFVAPGATKYDFGILNSKMHMSWMRTVAGRLKSDYRYSNTIVYNNFIWPDATKEQKTAIESLAQAVLDARAEFPGSSLADLYDPLTMPPSLAKAHKILDRAVDKLYRKEPFQADADRVAMLFEMYQEYTNHA